MQHATEASRILMGDSLAFHIIFVLFGLTLPILVSWFELAAIRRKDPALMRTARMWSKIMALLVITGVISGTVIALQMSLVWPGILQFGGKVIGLPFMFETYAFLIEAVFLALYMATWDRPRVTPMTHWLFGLGIVLGSTLSAYAITSVNAWMNLPTGFTFVNGAVQNADVWRAMFSQASVIEFVHSMPGYYLAASLAIAGLYALKLSRAKLADRAGAASRLDWRILHRLMVFAALALVLTVVTADLTGKYLAKHEPAKLATIELVNDTRGHAPFVFGGIATANGGITGPYISVPSALSILVGGSPSSQVTGLRDVPGPERPPAIIRAIFNLKLTAILGMSLVMAAYFALKYLRPQWLPRKPWLVVLGLAGFLGIVIVEFGWMITELGRQPWAVRGYVTTEQAVTKTHDITRFGYVFPLAYVLLFAVTALAIRTIMRHARAERAEGGR